MTAQLAADPSQPLSAGGRAGRGGACTPLVQRHVPENMQTVLPGEALAQQGSEGQLRPQASQVSRGARQWAPRDGVGNTSAISTCMAKQSRQGQLRPLALQARWVARSGGCCGMQGLPWDVVLILRRAASSSDISGKTQIEWFGCMRMATGS